VASPELTCPSTRKLAADVRVHRKVCANRALLWDDKVLLREYRALLRADLCVRLVHREVCM